MRIGVTSRPLGPGLDLKAVVDEAVAAGAAGFDSLWFPENDSHDPLSLVALVGQATTGVELGTAVVRAHSRHPVSLGLQAATVRSVVGDRLTLGVGVSLPFLVEHGLGVSFDRPLRFMRDYLEILLAFTREGRVDYDGAALSAHVGLGTPGTPIPFPVVLGTLSEGMLSLAGTFADGAICSMTGPRGLAGFVVPTLERAASGAGRRAPRVIVSLPVMLAADADQARDRIQDSVGVLEAIGPYRAAFDREGVVRAADVALVGDERAIEAGLAALADAGATEFVAFELGTPEERQRTRAFLASLARRASPSRGSERPD